MGQPDASRYWDPDGDGLAVRDPRLAGARGGRMHRRCPGGRGRYYGRGGRRRDRRRPGRARRRARRCRGRRVRSGCARLRRVSAGCGPWRWRGRLSAFRRRFVA
ncbi:hypothetical protein DWX16_04175 [Collinsella sp. AF18-33LB]|nr:hypothetical protein DWX24_08030 [Collinsella sp. AF18-8]RGT66080.1 hypothetical protein DWX16_04175 [Collinsella sp. AF18-33LB]